MKRKKKRFAQLKFDFTKKCELLKINHSKLKFACVDPSNFDLMDGGFNNSSYYTPTTPCHFQNPSFHPKSYLC